MNPPEPRYGSDQHGLVWGYRFPAGELPEPIDSEAAAERAPGDLPEVERPHLEERWITVGLTEKGRVLVLAHTIFDGGRRVRMISAREATRKERSFYEER